MMPLPQLLDGLGRGRLEVAQNALSLHHRAFRSEFLKHLSCGAVTNAEEHIGRMAILFETILNHLKKCDKKTPFWQSLLNLTSDHMKMLQQELEGFKLSTSSNNSVQQKKAVLELLNFHLNHVKALMKDLPRSPLHAAATPTRVTTMAHVHSSSTSNVLMNTLSSKSDQDVVQYALLSADAVDCAKKILLSRGGRNAAEVNEFFETVADTYINELLQKRQLDRAKDVISNTDRDIWLTLKALCLDTTDTSIRDYLAFELNTMNILESTEIEAWKFLILIEGVIKNIDLGVQISDDSLQIVRPVDEKNKFDVSIARLLALPSTARSSFLAEVYLKTLDGTLEPMLDKDEFWTYLVSNDRLEILLKWIHISCSKTTVDTERPDRLSAFLSTWDISQSMVDCIPTSKCLLVTKECLLDCLSRFNLFSTEELNDVHRRFLREIHTSKIFNGMDDRIKELLIEFCVQCHMPDLLVSCDIKPNSQPVAWMKFYSQHQDLKNDPDLKKSLLAAVEYSADYLNISKTDSKWMSLASILLSDEPLESFIENKEGSTELEAASRHHPKLTPLLASITENQNPVDLSLQQLLKGKFDYQMLKEQSLSSMFKESGSGSEIDFSHEPSMLLHGHQEALDFQYFLKQGRPCHASMLVLAEVIRSFGKPSRKLLKRYILPAHELALLNSADPTITGSCIAFIEMLGETTLSLRTHIAALHQIASSKSDASPCDPSNKSTNGALNQLVIDGKTISPQELFDLLMCDLPLNLHMQGLAVQLANLHKLALPRSFLEHCAQKDDWIGFILFCQIYSYPPDIITEAAQHFMSAALKGHFESFLQKYLVTSKSACRSRGEFLRQKSQTPLSEAPVPKDSEPATATSQIREGGVLPVAKDSLFGVLLSCHGCGDPAEALLNACVEIPCPVLAVLADFYQATDEAKLATWLASWLPKEDRVEYESWQKNTPWPPEMVESVILKSLEVSSSNLLSGFKLFLPEHPLVQILIMVEEFSKRDKLLNVEVLLKFNEFSLKWEKEKSGNSWCLNNASFTISICTKILLKALECLPSSDDKIKFVQILVEGYSSLIPDGTHLDQLKNLLDLLWVLSSTDVQINISNFLKNRSEEILVCTEKLVSLRLYKEASLISDQTFVVVEQLDKFEKWLENNYQDFKAFCIESNACFEEAMVNPSDAFVFFCRCKSDLKTNVDRWRALHCALKWLQRSTSNSTPNDFAPSVADEIELEMWKCCLCEDDPAIFNVLAEELQNSSWSKLCTKELGISNFSFTEVFHQCDSTCFEQSCPSELINCLLDVGDIVSASRVCNLFQSNHQDLEILHSCVSLVEGKLKVAEIPTHWVLFPVLKFGETLQNAAPRGRKKDSTSSSESIKSFQGSSEENNSKVLSVIQELSKQLKHGREIGKQLVAWYRLAINLDLAYKDVILISDPLKLVRSAMSHTHSGEYSVVSDVMMALRMSPADKVQFLSREIIAAISKGPATGNVKVFLLWGHDIEQNFRHLLELVPDPSILGNELMNMVCKLSIADKNTPKTVLTTAVELLVRAHDCYAAGCHMEGISQVLRSVSNFTQILKTRSEWALLVRLLTGIRRYTEMNYIFKVLKENDHFEFLLRKDSFKPLEFKLALLDWLRRECSNDVALLKMTAAHFQMHQQEAVLWQKEGKDRLSDLMANGLLNNQKKTMQVLEMAMQDFSHASECYLQGDMVNHALACAHQAELVALQQHLLNNHAQGSVVCVIQLDPKAIAKVVSTLGFHQALIVARAYNHRTDWAAALFYHCVSPGVSAEQYFSAWSSCMELSPLLIQNIAYRLQRTSGITKEMTTNMQWLLGHVKDMDVRYKIASELGLKDMVESLLQAPEVAYLKDTVWQSGFKGK